MTNELLYVSLNGERCSVLALDPSDRGLTLGDGAFETVLMLDGRLIYGSEHIARLIRALDVLGIVAVESRVDDALAAATAALAAQNAIVRISITRGPGARGLAADGNSPTLLVTASPWSKNMIGGDARLVTSNVRRNEGSPSSQNKFLSYVDQVLAAREAHACSVDDVLMLNNKGHAVCSSMANLWLLKGQELTTPPLRDGVLDGIVRARLLQLAEDCSLEPLERTIQPEELLDGGTVFLTNSVRLIRRVSQLDGIETANDSRVQQVQECLIDDIARRHGVDWPRWSGDL